MKKVSLLLAIAVIMVGSNAMTADTKSAPAVTPVVSSTLAVEAAPAIKGMDAVMVKDAVMAFITKDTALKGGAFLLFDVDKKNTKTLTLKNPVVKEAPVVQAEDTSVQSVEMVNMKGEKVVYTVDFQVKKAATGSMDVASIVVRKVGKKERFIYDEKGQVAPVPKKGKKSRK